MAKIHVLAGGGLNTFTVVVHAATPAGNNSANMPWAQAVKNSGRARSVLTVGTGPGQISQAEMDQIDNGEIIEAVTQWGDNPNWTTQERLNDLDLRATQLMNELLARYGQDLKYFGFTRA